MEEIIRQELDDVAKRAMCVLSPIKVVLEAEGIDEANIGTVLEVPDFPQKDASGTHGLSFTSTIYIDGSDFRDADSEDYFGLAPAKWVGLKYTGCILCRDIKRDAAGKVVEISARFAVLPPDGKRPRGNIHWVPSNAVPAEVRLYGHLFTVPFVTTNWEAELNHGSEVVVETALVDPSVLDASGALPIAEEHFQFERVGVFVVDKDTSASGRLVFNRTVPLKVAKSAQMAKSSKELDKDAKRKAEQAAALKLKKDMENVDPRVMFKTGSDAAQYSKWDDEGVPTHDDKGEPIAKSHIKKLKKEWLKQEKNFRKTQGGGGAK